MTMLDFPAALARLAALAIPVRTERVPVSRALGRVLAEPVVMDRDQPAFDRATMDGYAVAPHTSPGPGPAEFRVVGVVAAGVTFPRALAPGEAVRIMTGAPVPSAAADSGPATVVPIELTSAGVCHAPGAVSATGPDTITVLDASALTSRRNVARRGEDARAGDVVLAPGTRLCPVHYAAAAMAGAGDVTVAIAPHVAIVTTGDEVGREDAAGVRDTNKPLLTGVCHTLGASLSHLHALDEQGALELALSRAAGSVRSAESTLPARIVVTTGGVSMGDKDLVPGAAARLGFEVVFHKVAIQPGKPIFVARRADGTLLFGLPGNPVSVLATAHLFLVPALDRCLGVTTPRWITATMGETYRHDGQRHLFLPATLVDGQVHPIRWNGSGDLFSAAAGDGLLDLPVGASFERGAPVRFLPYVGHRLGERGVLPPRGAR
jgi:molybdopterin molybdotransferase